MSQRLHIGETTEEFYDCVITEEEGVLDKLLEEWVMLGGGWFFGPWKITVEDINLFKKVEPDIQRMFRRLGKEYPECVWMFFRRGSKIEHPTARELSKWIEEQLMGPKTR